MREETGLDVELTGILGIYTDPEHVIAYDDGEVRQEFVVGFTARIVSGELKGSDESTGVRWVPMSEIAPVTAVNVRRSAAVGSRNSQGTVIAGRNGRGHRHLDAPGGARTRYHWALKLQSSEKSALRSVLNTCAA